MFKKLITFKIIKYWFDMLVVYLNTHENKYAATSFFLSCHYKHRCICVCIYVLIYNLLSPYTYGSFHGWPFGTRQRTIVFFPGEEHPSLSQLCSVACSSLSRLMLHGLCQAHCPAPAWAVLVRLHGSRETPLHSKGPDFRWNQWFCSKLLWNVTGYAHPLGISDLIEESYNMQVLFIFKLKRLLDHIFTRYRMRVCSFVCVYKTPNDQIKKQYFICRKHEKILD